MERTKFNLNGDEGEAVKARSLSDMALIKELCSRFSLEAKPDSIGCIMIAEDCIYRDKYGEPASDGRWIMITHGITDGLRRK